MSIEIEKPVNRVPWRKSDRDNERRFDTTELDITIFNGYIVHRDYSAHYFKYGFAKNHIIGHRALEIGCGSKAPLVWTSLYTGGPVHPELLVCVDIDEIKTRSKVSWVRYHEKTDATDEETKRMLLSEYGPFERIVSLEVIEHMPKADGFKLLETIRDLLAPDGYALISTPVFERKMAANHIHEYDIDELAEWIDKAGLRVADRWGTFMHLRKVKEAVKATFPPEQAAGILAVWEKVHEYYGDAVASNFFAPVFPDYARNNVWKLVRK